jgi:antitoxin MazE
MQVSKWGNSLAVRLPASVVRELGLKEGDEIEIRAGEEQALEVTHDLSHLKALDARLKAIEELRKLAVPLPPGYKFSRDEIYDGGHRGSRS